MRARASGQLTVANCPEGGFGFSATFELAAKALGKERVDRS